MRRNELGQRFPWLNLDRRDKIALATFSRRNIRQNAQRNWEIESEVSLVEPLNPQTRKETCRWERWCLTRKVQNAEQNIGNSIDEAQGGVLLGEELVGKGSYVESGLETATLTDVMSSKLRHWAREKKSRIIDETKTRKVQETPV
jgi:hypothetical protein